MPAEPTEFEKMYMKQMAEMAEMLQKLKKDNDKLKSKLKRKRVSKESSEESGESGEDMEDDSEDSEGEDEPVNFAAVDAQGGGVLNYTDLMDSIGDDVEALEEMREDNKMKEEFLKLQGEIRDKSIEYINKFLFTIGDKNLFGEEQYDDYENEKVIVYRKTFKDVVVAYKEMEPYLMEWFKSDKRRRYHKIVLDPSIQGHLNSKKMKKYNLFDGFKLGPDTKYDGDYMAATQPLRDHIRYIICRGVESDYHWVIKWLACTLQRPEVKIGIAIVLKGDKGCGKGHVPEIMKLIMGDKYYFHAQNEEDMYGKFAPRDSMTHKFVFADESSFSGNRQHCERLKTMITALTKTIEDKGISKYQMNSLVNLWMASNHPKAVDAAGAERRFAVFECDNTYAGAGERQRLYHDPIIEVPPEAFAEYLYSIDLGDFVKTCRSTCPATSGLRDQKMRSLSVMEEWWNWCLSNQLLYKTKAKPDQDPDAEHMHWSFPELPDYPRLYNSLREYNKDHPRKYNGEIPGNEVFTMDFKKFVPANISTRPRGNGSRTRVYKLASLEACRQQWCNRNNDPKWFDEPDKDLEVAESVAGRNQGYVSEFKAMDMSAAEEEEPVAAQPMSEPLMKKPVEKPKPIEKPKPVAKPKPAEQPKPIEKPVEVETRQPAPVGENSKDPWYQPTIDLRRMQNPESNLYKTSTPEKIAELKKLIEDLKKAASSSLPSSSSSSSSSSSFAASRGVPQVTRHQMPMNYDPNQKSYIIKAADVYDPNCKFKLMDI